MNLLLEMGLSNAVQVVLLAVLAAVVGVVCRRPAFTHRLWLLVLLKLVTPPILPVPILWSQGQEAMENATSAAGKEAVVAVALAEPAGEDGQMEFPPWAEEDASPDPNGTVVLEAKVPPQEPREPTPALLSASLMELLGPIWLLGSLVWFVWTGWNIYCFQRLLAHARPARADLQAESDQLARRMGLPRMPGVWLVPGAVSPMVWAVGGPARLLFPARLLDRLDAGQRATLLAHELAHLKRRDHWVRWLELLVLGLFWWHPVAWWGRRELHEAEEQCCDAWVLWAITGASRSYAMALLQTVAFFSPDRSRLPAAASGIGQVPHLRRRLTMIMQGTTPRSLSWAGCVGVLALGLLLPVLPVQGQSAPAKDAAAKDSRDDQIEALKKALRVLEEQRASEKAKSAAPKADPAEIKELEASAAQLMKTVQVKRDELQAIEMKLRVIVERLQKMGGNVAGFKTAVNEYRTIVSPRTVIEAKALPGQRTYSIQQPEKNQQPATIRLKAGDGDKEKELIIEALIDKGALKAKVAEPAAGNTPLEQRLDRLLKEIEDIRREIRRPVGSAPAAEYHYRVVTPPAVPASPQAYPAPPKVPAPPRPGAAIELPTVQKAVTVIEGVPDGPRKVLTLPVQPDGKITIVAPPDKKPE